MGIINVVLEDERGSVIGSVHGDTHLLDPLLPSISDGRWQCLRFIDPYGEMVFNRLQMDQFMLEWHELSSTRPLSAEERQVLKEVQALAEMCKDEPHLYLRFSGD